MEIVIQIQMTYQFEKKFIKRFFYKSINQNELKLVNT